MDHVYCGKSRYFLLKAILTLDIDRGLVSLFLRTLLRVPPLRYSCKIGHFRPETKRSVDKTIFQKKGL